MNIAYNEAALRHYTDAERLAADERFDNAGHLIGFSAECAIKYAFAMTEVDDESPRVHLPILVNRVLKKIKNKNPREVPLLHVLMETRDGFFHDWRVAARYDADGCIDKPTYRKWERLAKRALGAAGLRQ
jgi:hypothetical protein